MILEQSGLFEKRLTLTMEEAFELQQSLVNVIRQHIIDIDPTTFEKVSCPLFEIHDNKKFPANLVIAVGQSKYQ